MAFKSQNEIEGNKKYESRSQVFRVFLLLGLTKIIILVVVFVYFYSSLMDCRDTISMLQTRMVSMEKMCSQLTSQAVASRQQTDNLIKAHFPPYTGVYDEEPLYDDYNAYETENHNTTTENPFASNETTPTANRNVPVREEEEERTADDADSYLCDITDLEEFKRHCCELHSQHGRVKRSNQRGPVATHFKGGLPETFIQDSGLVAPWYPDSRSSAEFGLPYEFREGKGKVQVADSGLYFIYAQVYYLTNHSQNSYAVNIKEQDSEMTPVAFCSSNAVVPLNGGITEVSCYTSVVRFLNASTEVFITQRERNRRMILREGHTFLGLVRLNKRPEPKRQRGGRN